jgi:transcription-repair coupling factor (superfamily II helicase)
MKAAERFLSLARGIPEVAEACRRLRGAEVRLPEGRLVFSGAVGPLPGLVLAALATELGEPLILITPDETSASRAAADASAAGLSGVFLAPEPSLTPYQRVAPSLKFRKTEFALLSSLAEGCFRLAAVPVRFLFGKLPSPDSFVARRLPLAKGNSCSLAGLIAYLAREGYSRTDLVLETGDFAVRGGLVDVFPPDSERPLRIELDGEEIASLRTFDPDTQRSEVQRERISLSPLSLAAESVDAEGRLSRLLGRPASGAERAVFLSAAAGNSATLFDYAPRAAMAVLEPGAIADAAREWQERVEADFSDGRDPFPPGELVHGAGSLLSELEARGRLAFDRVGLTEGVPLRLEAQEVAGFDGRVREAAAEVGRLQSGGERILATAGSPGGVEKVRRFAREYELSDLEIVEGVLTAGFRLRGQHLTVFTEEEIFGPERHAPRPRKSASEAFLSDLRDLKTGDFVVHTDYGVGRFRGLKRFTVEGAEREFAEIAYLEEKTLLLPVERLDLIQKYAGAEGDPPLDRLGSASWARKKESARKAARDLSSELLNLYARRAQSVGFAFSKDSPWQKEFDDAFEFVETPDQAQAIAEVKRDMERPAPMDRLLCGDVGYGKTEVAMRAAFKAVLDGKQVALLAPTTILADQHFRTFQRRFAAFPVTIELLSRFRERAAQKRITEQIADGRVDIVVATHRLLSRDIAFRDLGLLIIDEEQRFGVAQKERLKGLRTSIDLLSMSATPIPRSLNLSLSGIRDLSIIETPPRDRLAIETQVVPKKPEVIREAIAWELSRGGQVFYVHNRVESIGREMSLLRELLPEARIAVGHGQLSETELERTMADFIARKSDILLATSIVENGLDIPSVNTILIDRADAFGLSQLYQLRGRVGRSDKAAFCYLLIEPQAALSETARRRLATIREFCDLGAGFRIAAKDLEIRGAGNFLGAEQSGHIAAVGLELYLDLLEAAIRELKGEEAPAERTVSISLPSEVSIPASYLPDESLRLSLYKRIARARDDGETADIARETEDRFGPLPEEVRHLLEFARLRRRAERLGVKAIERHGRAARLVFHEGAPVDPQRVKDLLNSTPGAALSPAGVLTLPGQFSGAALLELLDRLAERAAA